MPSRYPRLDREKARTLSIAGRTHKVKVEDLAQLGTASFLDGLPAQLKAVDWKEFCGSLAAAFRQRLPVIAMLGAHVIKVGCGPVLIDWVRRGYLTAVAFNGATAIHDAELAMWGATSEDVEEGLADGSFGMVEETPRLFAAAAERAEREDLGLGEALGAELEERKAPHAGASLAAACHEHRVPLTVHVALGTDTIHQHHLIDGARLGAASLTDFRVLAAAVAKLVPGSVVLNLGSAVILPEVFLKVLTLARNLGHECKGLISADFSMIPQYRPAVNVVGRPTRTGGGKGYSFTGHHELLLPLLHRCVEECLGRALI
ncbi:MAG: hypothetical protein A3F83_16920 [Candidatus Glassbacteria bacterium RIFCSPLOWO2_12_FULL_58_11]|uniref:Deoxyhypusine synthase n=2 Tax=Candidatus Glassiibacteriota TaxID=1817805 RepID=A0A1F5YM57_9BACT|nr:MAG: hypothetical protein A3F83_16920 [Candidatus Glassbacteria bacterium RIFCSPLOWO2_12_FULL_58_11]